MSGCKSVWARGANARGRTIGRGEALTSSLISPLPKFLPLALPLSLPSPLCGVPFIFCEKMKDAFVKVQQKKRKVFSWSSGALQINCCAASAPPLLVLFGLSPPHFEDEKSYFEVKKRTIKSQATSSFSKVQQEERKVLPDLPASFRSFAARLPRFLFPYPLRSAARPFYLEIAE